MRINFRARVRVWRSVFWRPWVVLLHAIWGLIGLGQFAYQIASPYYQQRVTRFAWLLDRPWWAWLIGFALLALMTTLEGAYRVVKEREAVIRRSASNLKMLTASLPNIIFREFRDSPIWIQEEGATERTRAFDIFQIWFVNAPHYPSENSIAQKITAGISFWTSDERTKLFVFYGQWTKDIMPDFIRYQGVEPTRDILPGILCAKLNVAFKWPDETDAYGYAVESFETHDGGRDPSRAIPPGEYRCRIELRGVGVHVDHWLKVINPSAGGLRMEFVRSVPHMAMIGA